MISVETSVETNKNASGAITNGTRRALLDAGQRGVNTALEHVPHGATSGLSLAMFGPQEMQDGSVTWGNSSEYAEPVEDGSDPHWIPAQAVKTSLSKWARRVLGDESAAWAVRHKIAQEGTPAQPFIQPGIDAMKAFLRSHGISGYITEELRSHG